MMKTTGSEMMKTTGLTDLLFSIDDHVTVTTIEKLLNVKGQDLLRLMLLASEIRDRHFGKVITYSRKVFIPLTNICANACHYCNFRKSPDEVGAHIMYIEDAIEQVRKWEVKYGVKEVLVCTGERPDVYPKVRDKLRTWGFKSYIDYVRTFLERLLKKTEHVLPHVNIGYLTLEELEEIRPFAVSVGLMLECASARLCERGMPHEFSPTKHPRYRIEFLHYCEKLSIPVTTGILVGIGETLTELARSILLLKVLCEKLSCIQEVIVQNYMPGERSKILCKTCREVSIYEMVRIIATTRIVLRGLTSIQAPPNLALRSYGMYILAGINDWGGVSPVTPDYVNPDYPWPSISELKKVTEDLGYTLRERLPIYPKYVKEYRKWIPDTLRDRVLSLVDDDGLVRPELTYY